MSGLTGSIARAGLELTRVVRDRLDGRCPVPRTIDEVDATYLARRLGAVVDRAEPVDRTAGTTDRARLRLWSADPAVPSSAFVKIAPTATTTRVFTNLADLGAKELGFYRDIRPHLDIEAPRALALDLDRPTRRFCVVIDDLAERGARFTDTLVGVTAAEAEAVVAALGRLHGRWWGSPRLDDHGTGGLAWVTANRDDPNRALFRVLISRAIGVLERLDADLLPPVGRRILEGYVPVAADLDEGPHTVLHGDPHPGNVYFLDRPSTSGAGGDITGGLFDWQVTSRGNGVRDLTYFLVLALEPEVRRAHGADLADRYRDEVAAAGGPRLTADAVRHDMRRMVAYAFTAAAFTTAYAGLQEQAIARRGLEKAVAALADLETATALSCLR